MNTENILLTYAAKTLGMSEDAVTDLLTEKSEDGDVSLKEDALSTLLDRDQARVANLKMLGKETLTRVHDEAFAEAKKSVLGKAEKRIAESKGIEYTGQKLNDLIDEIEAKAAKTSPDEIKKHPVYLALEREKAAREAELLESHTAAIEQMTTTHNQRLTQLEAKSTLMSELDALNPILPTDKKKAENQKNLFAANFFSKYGVQDTESGYILLDDEGKRIEDKHGNPMYLKDGVQNAAAEMYEFRKQGEKGSAANEDGPTGPTADVHGMSAEEYTTAILQAETMEARNALVEAREAGR